MEDPGKIMVVVVVLAVIFAGIVIYMAMLDRKLSRIEKQFNEKKVKTDSVV